MIDINVEIVSLSWISWETGTYDFYKATLQLNIFNTQPTF